MTFHHKYVEEGNSKSKNNNDYSNLLCYRCGQYEDCYANEFPYTEDEAEKMKAAGPEHNPEKSAKTILIMHIVTDETPARATVEKTPMNLITIPPLATTVKTTAEVMTDA